MQEKKHRYASYLLSEDTIITKPAGKRDIKYYFTLILLPVLLTLILAINTEPMTNLHPMYSQGGDHLVYIEMAQQPFAAHEPPYCYRLLVPTIARYLPFSLAVNFYLLAVLFIIGTGILLHLFLRDLGCNLFYSSLGVILFYSLNWGAKFLLFDFWLTEAALFFFVVLSLLLILRDSRVWLVVALCLAVLCKESALFLLPLIYTLRARHIIDGPALLRAVLLSIVPIALFVVLRLTITTDTSYNLVTLWKEIGVPRLTEGLVGYIRGVTVGTWGIVALLLPFFCSKRGRGFALRSMPFLLLVLAQPLFAINVDRLIVPAFPIVIPLAMNGLEDIQHRFRLSQWMVLGYVAIPYILILIKSGYQSPSPEQRLLILAIWTLIIFIVKLRLRRNPVKVESR
jgi:hypothetical protein